ncbi:MULTISPECIES: SAM-dependent methyltransferase [Sphingomonadaceae]|uniref:SAM-dependent methyltransferase n=1 Tax=Sphingomonadales TaxID=204457 RepID=UPI00076FE88B|nr:cyclopropane-fatty-acyl-phospholipid synthase family protein [Sphingobium sp. TKS]AMK22919.1 cyclopropane-fatty-acyl-phospholipid synthase [Sphingobium sp. TKS]MCF8706658.1 cyclopropane-fatty-acyl-phospholipid synthase family protein [Rhizorhapis sp. SPR117]
MWLLDKLLSRLIKSGELILFEADGTRHDYGSPQEGRQPVTVRFTDRGAPNAVARNPRLGAAETWMDGRLLVDGDDILGLIDLVQSNAAWEEEEGDALRGNLITSLASSLMSRQDRLNWKRRSKRNVAHHYDLDHRLYDAFLDSDRQYSCGYFSDLAAGLEQAQTDKKAHIAAKLQLKPGQHVLDIGCGWGGMALYLNRVADVDVLAITLSEEQLEIARRRAQEAGVAGRVKFELIDYRDLTGTFDRIVSVGMFEHVGPPYYRRFFQKCRTMLAEDGVMLLHTIGRMGRPGSTDPFTSKYIFPGGYIPALSEIIRSSEVMKLIVADVETLRLHYAHTLEHWYRRTVAGKDRIAALYDARFYRMWTFYLAGALAAFRHGELCNYQIQYIRRRDALPIVRDYMLTLPERK